MSQPLVKDWIVKGPPPPQVMEALSEYSSVMRHLLFNRGITSAEQARTFLTASGPLYDPFLLKDMRLTVQRLLRALENHEPIAVYGDYDVDGVTGTALLVQVLKRMGADAREKIPNRFEEGYGINNDALDALYADGVRVVVSVDCGIRSPREAEHARQVGLDLIISDHHHPKDDLPQAYAVVCPKQAGDEYPDKDLAGVGLAFKIAQALLAEHPVEGVCAEDWLDLVAVGTVADLVPLQGENRAMVRAGLRQLRSRPRQGLASLAGAARMENINALTARDIGFMIGPRLNAAGRLESALAAYNLLVAEDPAAAGPLALKLDDTNRERQKMTHDMQLQAAAMAEGECCDHLVFAVNPDFNMGVVGLVASKLTESYYRPSIVGARGEEETRASCRSIPEFHITQALDEVSELLVRHGGHAMAAGFTVRNENLPELRRRLEQIAARELGEQVLRPQLRADLEIGLRDLKPEILRDLDLLEPTGQTNPEVYFVSRGLRVTRSKAIGAEGAHLRFTVLDGVAYDAVAFRQGHWADHLPPLVDILYSYERNSYMGRESLQLNVKDIKPSAMQ
ncbi:MAG: single-stranded-DNA-specific exonuclease RecJ [Chloroflexi bacterium]|nr:single-stranded-DNA-specific exonuclease RecJ [Chloroflexota bacterium]